jgi:hypothetical protein
LWALGIACLWWQTPALSAQEGRLQQVREEVRGDDEHADKKEKKEKKTRERDSDADDDCLFGELFWRGLILPFVLPPALLGDDYHHDGYFLSHPYQHGLPGFMRIEGFLDEGLPPGSSPLDRKGLRAWIGRLTLQESNDFRGLNRVNGQLLLDSWSRFGLQTGWTYLSEGLTGGRHDDMVLGDLDLLFRFAQNEYVQMRTRLGARVLADSHSRWGFNITYGGDFFPAKPLVLSGVLDLGTLGSAGLVHARGTAGVIFRGWEFFTGYDFMRIGSVNLQGPTLGLRFWF